MTVEELRQRLGAYPAWADVMIVDADTGWLLAIQNVDWEKHTGDNVNLADEMKDAVLIAGSYYP